MKYFSLTFFLGLYMMTNACTPPTSDNWFLTPSLDGDTIINDQTQIRDIRMLNADTGFVLVWEEDRVVQQGLSKQDQNALLYRSSDGGRTFKRLILGKGRLTSFTESADKKSLYLIRSEFSDSTKIRPNNYQVLKSVDAGASWQELCRFENKWLSKILFYNDQIGFAMVIEDPIGYDIETLYKTEDGGKTWQPTRVNIDKLSMSMIEKNQKIIGRYLDYDALALWEMDIRDLQVKQLPLKVPTNLRIYGSLEKDPLTGYHYIKLGGRGDKENDRYLYCVETEVLQELPKYTINFNVYGDFIGTMGKYRGNMFVSEYRYSLDGGKTWKSEIPKEPTTITGTGMFGRGYIWKAAQRISDSHASIMVRIPDKAE